MLAMHQGQIGKFQQRGKTEPLFLEIFGKRFLIFFIDADDADSFRDGSARLTVGDPKCEALPELTLKATKVAQDVILFENDIEKYHSPYTGDLIYFPLYVRVIPAKVLQTPIAALA